MARRVSNQQAGRIDHVHHSWDASAPRCLSFVARGSTADLFIGRPCGGDMADIMVKALRPDAVRHSRRCYRFARECAVLQQVDHRSLPHLDQACPEPCHGAYLVYRYIEGLTLRETLSSPVPLDRQQRMILAERLLCDIPSALGHLQALPGCYAHGDIAPRNIVVGPERLSLIDLGLARPTLVETSADDLFGIAQPAYLSPEQAQGCPWDERSDYYQIGLVLYEIFTGQRYNQGCSLRECRLNAASSTPRGGIWSAIPPSFRRLVYGLLEPSPELRPRANWYQPTGCTGA